VQQLPRQQIFKPIRASHATRNADRVLTTRDSKTIDRMLVVAVRDNYDGRTIAGCARRGRTNPNLPNDPNE
jgi:hypothetical protein